MAPGSSAVAVAVAVLKRLQDAAQQAGGVLVAVGAHDPVEPAPTRYVRGLDPGADDVDVELRVLPVVAAEVVHQGRHRVVEQRQLYRHAYLPLVSTGLSDGLTVSSPAPGPRKTRAFAYGNREGSPPSARPFAILFLYPLSTFWTSFSIRWRTLSSLWR